MKIKVFFVSGAARQLFGTLDYNIRKILCSYWYYKTAPVKKMIFAVKEKMKNDKEFELFIDSGAFSAFTKGIKISVDGYCKYIQEINPTQYAALDVIGDPEASEKNTLIMEDKYGLKPIPAYHLCEDYKYLHRMIKKYDYIAFGGMVGASKEKLVSWLDNAWHIVLKEKPQLKVHGFGMTNLEILKMYPWYSVDSSSITSSVRYGNIAFISENGNIKKQRTSKFVYEYGLNNDQSIFSDNNKKQVVCLVQAANVFMKQIETLEEERKKINYNSMGGKLSLPGFEI